MISGKLCSYPFLLNCWVFVVCLLYFVMGDKTPAVPFYVRRKNAFDSKVRKLCILWEIDWESKQKRQSCFILQWFWIVACLIRVETKCKNLFMVSIVHWNTMEMHNSLEHKRKWNSVCDITAKSLGNKSSFCNHFLNIYNGKNLASFETDSWKRVWNVRDIEPAGHRHHTSTKRQENARFKFTKDA